MFLNLYQPAWAAITKCHGPNGSHLFRHGSRDGKSDIRMPTWLPPSEAYFPDIDTAFSLCDHVAFPQYMHTTEKALVSRFTRTLVLDRGPTNITSLNLDHFHRCLVSKEESHSGLGLQEIDLGGGEIIQSIAAPLLR